MGPVTFPRAVLLLAALALVALAALPSCGEALDEGPGRKGGVALDPGYVKDEFVAEGGFHKRTVLTHTYLLAANKIAQMPEPFRIRPFDVKERVFITAWSSNTEDAKGNREPDDIHCHSSLSDNAIRAGESQIWSGICTDGFTPRFVLPEGYAMAVEPGASYFFRPMFNNRRPESRFSRMRVVIDYQTESEAKGRLKALMAFVVSAVIPENYSVPPQELDVKTRAFDLPFSGRIHAIGAHLHPYGQSVALQRESDHMVMFTAKMSRAEDLGDWKLSTYASKEGFYVERGESYRITGTYVNDSDKRADAMAGFFIFYDPDGKPDR